MKQNPSKLLENIYAYEYNNKSINYSVWANNTIIENIIYLGTVQIGKMPQWVCEHCPPHTAVIQGAPHWYAKNDGSDIPEFMLDFTKSAIESIIENFELCKLNIIADSQAVPGVVELLNHTKYQQYLKNIVLLQPLGFNTFAFTGSDKETINIFKKRIIANTRYQIKPLINDAKLRYNHRLLNNKVNFNDATASAQYNSGLKHDATNSLKKLLSSCKNIQIICAENDKIFPQNEIIHNLQNNDIKISVESVKDIPHSPLGTKYGYRLLDAAFEFIYSKPTR